MFKRRSRYKTRLSLDCRDYAVWDGLESVWWNMVEHERGSGIAQNWLAEYQRGGDWDENNYNCSGCIRLCVDACVDNEGIIHLQQICMINKRRFEIISGAGRQNVQTSCIQYYSQCVAASRTCSIASFSRFFFSKVRLSGRRVSNTDTLICLVRYCNDALLLCKTPFKLIYSIISVFNRVYGVIK